MKTTWNHYYGILQRLSLFTGMWPYLEPRTRLFRVILLNLIVSSVAIPQLAQQLRCKQDLQCIFESMTSCLLTGVAMVKIWGFQLNIRKVRFVIYAQDKIEKFTEHLFGDWKELETPQEYEIMKSYAENCRRFSLFYPVYCFSATYMFMSISVIPPVLDIIRPLNESRSILLPYPGYYFVDSRKYFFYIFGHSIVCWEIIMTGIVAHDCMFVSYIEHICSMFAIVGFRFECLFHSFNNAIGDIKEDLDDAYRKKIAFFVDTHRKTLEFAHLLENTFTIPFAIQLFIIIVTMSCTLLQITQQQAGFLEATRYVLYVIGQLFHLFCLSFEGQKLIDHSLWMRDKIYNSLWYEAPLKARRLLILTMIRSFRPTFLSAGKIYIFSLESFTTVLQTSMSYFTVLSSV